MDSCFNYTTAWKWQHCSINLYSKWPKHKFIYNISNDLLPNSIKENCNYMHSNWTSIDWQVKLNREQAVVCEKHWTTKHWHVKWITFSTDYFVTKTWQRVKYIRQQVNSQFLKLARIRLWWLDNYLKRLHVCNRLVLLLCRIFFLAWVGLLKHWWGFGKIQYWNVYM